MPQKALRRELSPAQRNQLVGAIESMGKITQSACNLDIHPSTAKSLWKRYKETGLTDNQPRSGRPSLYSTPEKALIVGYATPPGHAFSTAVARLCAALRDAIALS